MIKYSSLSVSIIYTKCKFAAVDLLHIVILHPDTQQYSRDYSINKKVGCETIDACVAQHLQNLLYLSGMGVWIAGDSIIYTNTDGYKIKKKFLLTL